MTDQQQRDVLRVLALHDVKLHGLESQVLALRDVKLHGLESHVSVLHDEVLLVLKLRV